MNDRLKKDRQMDKRQRERVRGILVHKSGRLPQRMTQIVDEQTEREKKRGRSVHERDGGLSE